MDVLSQFILRLSFGLALAMAITSARRVTAGYFRVHSSVLLGMNALAAVIAWMEPTRFEFWPPLTAAILSYLSSAAWLYEARRFGKVFLFALSGVSLWGAYLAQGGLTGAFDAPAVLRVCDAPTGGFLLGATLAAMFLGHWYLNTPTMALSPLFRLIGLMGLAVGLRGLVCGVGLGLELAGGALPGEVWMIALRWLFGLLGTLVLTIMAWRTLLIPNTQSATGILYVGVIATFVGELASLLLSGAGQLPL